MTVIESDDDKSQPITQSNNNLQQHNAYPLKQHNAQPP